MASRVLIAVVIYAFCPYILYFSRVLNTWFIQSFTMQSLQWSAALGWLSLYLRRIWEPSLATSSTLDVIILSPTSSSSSSLSSSSPWARSCCWCLWMGLFTWCQLTRDKGGKLLPQRFEIWDPHKIILATNYGPPKMVNFGIESEILFKVRIRKSIKWTRINSTCWWTSEFKLEFIGREVATR